MSKRAHARRWVSVAVLALSAVGCQSSAQPTASSRTTQAQLGKGLDAILSAHHTQARYTCRVLELPSGRELFAHDADTPYMPASNLKLFTSAAALDRFGPDHKLKTYLAYDGINLWVIGTGDPACGDPKIAGKDNQAVTLMFDEWADVLKQKGLTDIKGGVYYYDRVFDDQLVHPSWSKSFAGDWYAAPVSGLNFNDNCVDLTLHPTADGQPMRYEIVPAIKNIEIVNKTRTVATTRPASIDRMQAANVFTLGGGATAKTNVESKAIVDPGAFFADAFRTHLASKGVAVAGPTRRALELPKGYALDPHTGAIKGDVLATHETPFTTALNRLNKNSQNLFAEAFAKMSGRDYAWQTKYEDVPGSWALGTEAAQAFLKSHGVDAPAVKLVDGSGLSRDNRVTARAVSDLLLAMSTHKYRQPFHDSLPIAGVDGTIGKRMKDIQGKVYAKTGYIGGVRALSGYAHTDGGKTLAFTIIYNDIPGNIAPFEALQDEACRYLVSYPKLDYKPNLNAATSRPTTRPARRLTTQTASN
jgi:D-alanyl-D-alanine carboxypeptidase/D-alanyl-D-alanine-endopeptidase (penicillin-binding protein 4)